MNDTHVNESILSEEILEDQKKNRIDHMTYLPGMEDIGSEIMDQVIEAMEAYDYSKCEKCTCTFGTYSGGFPCAVITGSPSIFGRNRPGSPDRDKKTFWKQCLYVHTDLYCKLL